MTGGSIHAQPEHPNHRKFEDFGRHGNICKMQSLFYNLAPAVDAVQQDCNLRTKHTKQGLKDLEAMLKQC